MYSFTFVITLSISSLADIFVLQFVMKSKVTVTNTLHLTVKFILSHL